MFPFCGICTSIQFLDRIGPIPLLIDFGESCAWISPCVEEMTEENLFKEKKYKMCNEC